MRIVLNDSFNDVIRLHAALDETNIQEHFSISKVDIFDHNSRGDFPSECFWEYEIKDADCAVII